MRTLILVLSAFAAVAAHADDCATGYTWNGDAAQCEITCNPGYYVATAGGECVPFPTGSQYIDIAHTVAYGNVTPESVKKTCPCDANGACGYVPDYFNGINALNNSIMNCIIYRWDLRYVMDYSLVNDYDVLYNNISSTHGVGGAPCYYSESTSNQFGSPIFNICVGGSTLQACDGGYYTDTVAIGNSLVYHPCNPVGTGFYSPDGDLNRYPCPDGTISGGFGDAADDISDCVPYKTLNISNGVAIQMSAVPRSEHNLVILGDEGQYYGKTTTSFVSDRIHIDLNGVIYTVINPLDEFEYVNNPEYSFYIIP